MEWPKKELKVGQKLRCIRGNNGCVTTNKVYTIKKKSERDTGYYIQHDLRDTLVWVEHGQSNFEPYLTFNRRTE